MGETPQPEGVAVERVVMRLRELSQAVAEGRMGEFSMRVPAEPERDADLVLQSAAALLESANRRAEYWEAEHLAGNSAIEDLQSVLRRLCDEVENTNLHGGGADDDACPLCNALRDVRELLTHNTGNEPRR